jgi:hypothetical protein
MINFWVMGSIFSDRPDNGLISAPWKITHGGSLWYVDCVKNQQPDRRS